MEVPCADSTKGLLEDSTAVEKVDAEGFDAVYVPGGHGVCADMPDCVPLQKFVATLYEKGAVVGSVCHGPAAFANIKLSNGEPLVKGKKVCSLLDVWLVNDPRQTSSACNAQSAAQKNNNSKKYSQPAVCTLVMRLVVSALHDVLVNSISESSTTESSRMRVEHVLVFYAQEVECLAKARQVLHDIQRKEVQH